MMKHTPQFSIIIPAYNAAKYITDCLDSIINQTHNDWEAIVVDDGSKDTTLDICYEYAQKDSRIKVIHKENGGTASARNMGLEQSGGEWIAFIDADDWFENNALEQLSNLIKQTNAEIIGFNHFYNKNRKQWKRDSIKPSPLIRTGEEELKWLILDTMLPYYDFVKNKVQLGPIRGVWSKIFKYSLLKQHKIKFDRDVTIIEDAIFCLDAFKYAHEVAFFDIYLIHYRIYSVSKIRRFHSEIVKINEQTIQGYYDRIEQHLNIDEDYQNVFLGMVCNCLFQALKCNILHKTNRKSIFEKVQEIKDLLHKPLWESSFAYGNIKYLPRGKKELAYCAKRKWSWGIYFIGLLSIWYLKIK